MKKLLMTTMAMTTMFFFMACGGDDPTDTDTEAAQDDTADNAVNDEAEVDNAEVPDEAAKSCQWDGDCGTGKVCVDLFCTAGCTADGECEAINPNLKCNTKLGRCLSFQDGNCDEDSCDAGCCSPQNDLIGLMCYEGGSAPDICGACPQGEVFMRDKNKCALSTCTGVTPDPCPSYDPEYACQSDGTCNYANLK